MTAPAPPPTAGEEARRLVGALKSSAIGYGTTGRDSLLPELKQHEVALLAHIAGLEAEVARLRSSLPLIPIGAEGAIARIVEPI